MGPFVGTLGGVVGGTMLSDTLGAVPMKDPATGAKTTADGSLVNSAPTARSSLHLSALIVLGSLGFLFLGSRVLRDARIA